MHGCIYYGICFSLFDLSNVNDSNNKYSEWNDDVILFMDSQQVTTNKVREPYPLAHVERSSQMSTITSIQGDCGGDSLRGTQGSLAIAKPKASPRQREYADIEGVPYRPKRTWSMRT